MRRTNLFFVKVPEEHRGARTVGSRSGGFSSGYRGGILQIFRQQFLLVFLGLFLIAGLILGVIFIRNADYSLLKTLDFVFFSNVKARSALPVLSIFVASLASSFLFLLFCFLCGLSIWGRLLCSVGSVIPRIWHGNYSRISVCGLWIPRIFISFGCYFTGSFYLSDCHFNRFQRKHAVFQEDTSWQENGEQEAQPKNNVRHFFIRFSILTGILIIGALVDVLTTVCFSGLFVF
ncbi:MAG: hypothetical protein V8Q17_02835 [Acutalibacteraceae bacterium]